MLKIWQIPYSDKRDRCGICLVLFNKRQFKKRSRNSLVRYPNKCFRCLSTGLTTKNVV